MSRKTVRRDLLPILVFGFAFFILCCELRNKKEDVFGDDLYTKQDWYIHIIDSEGNVGMQTSIALDSTDKVHIAYYDCGEGDENTIRCSKSDLKYATNRSGKWQTFIIDSGKVARFSTSIALDPEDNVHISYFSCDKFSGYNCSNAELRCAINESGEWKIFTIQQFPYLFRGCASLAIDPNDKIHIAYFTSGYYNGVRHATNTSGEWEVFDIDSDIEGCNLDLALDSNGNAHITYRWEYFYLPARLKYATNSSGTWQFFKIGTVEDSGAFMSICVDSGDKVHISYTSAHNSFLKYATNRTDSWEIFMVDAESGKKEWVSLALDLNDNAHISYYNSTWDELKYATNKAGSWQIYTIDFGMDPGEFSSLALDSQDNVHISYYESAYGDLKYATNAR